MDEYLDIFSLCLLVAALLLTLFGLILIIIGCVDFLDYFNLKLKDFINTSKQIEYAVFTIKSKYKVDCYGSSKYFFEIKFYENSGLINGVIQRLQESDYNCYQKLEVNVGQYMTSEIGENIMVKLKVLETAGDKKLSTLKYVGSVVRETPKITPIENDKMEGELK